MTDVESVHCNYFLMHLSDSSAHKNLRWNGKWSHYRREGLYNEIEMEKIVGKEKDLFNF